MSKVQTLPRAASSFLVPLLLLVLVIVVLLGLALAAAMYPSELSMLEDQMTRSTGLRWSINAGLAALFGVGVLCLLALPWSEPAAQAKPVAPAASAPLTEAERAKARREYVLEVVSLGVTLDKYRQGKLWEALSKGNAYASIREQDPNKYPWSGRGKAEQEGDRSGGALENGAKYTPSEWGVPTFAAGSPATLVPDDPYPGSIGIASGAESSGMSSSLFVATDWERAERPDRLMERVFAFFDENPDVPYVVVSAADGLFLRNLYRPKGTPALIRDGYYIPEMPDSTTLFVLARRERVDPLRRFAFKDFDDSKPVIDMDAYNSRGFARRMYLAYLSLSKRLPKPQGAWARTPTAPEWLQETAAIAQRTDMYPRPTTVFGLTWDEGSYPSREFKPTPWFPIPWNQAQLAEFDRLPTLGFIHRPVFVKTVDEQGQPLRRGAVRAAALAAGWEQALQTLPEAERATAPARVVVSTGGHTEQTVALSRVLAQWTEQGGPELDHQKPTEWVDTDARLGHTGAASWFMGMAIGVMGSYREGGATAAINLRDPAEASIVFVTPPPEDKRKTQHHSQGGDVWRSIVGPAMDPANYGP